MPTGGPALLMHAAYLLEKAGDLAQAIQVMTELGPPPNEPGFYYCEFAYYQERAGNSEEAIALYDKAFENSDGMSETFIAWIDDQRSRLKHNL